MLTVLKKPPEEFLELKIDNPQTAQIVAQAIACGEAVIINYNGAVYGLIFDPRNKKTVDQVVQFKKRYQKPFSAQADFSLLKKIIDFNKIETKFHDLLKNEKKLIQIFGAKFFLRIPIKDSISKQLNIPKNIIGMDANDKNTIHFISMQGHISEKLQTALLKALAQKYAPLPPILGVTSFNYHRQGSQNDPIFSTKIAKKENFKIIVHPHEFIEGLSFEIISFLKTDSFKIYRSKNLKESYQKLLNLMNEAEEAVF